MTDIQVPLVVDLDGTLLKTDTLFESTNIHIWSKPLSFIQIPLWLTKGKLSLKNNLAEAVNLEPDVLPYRTEVVDFVKAEKAKGRLIVLATASAEKYANDIAEHLGFIDIVLASSADINLKGAEKRDELVSRFGEMGFDYIGDSETDITVWRSARTSYMIDPKSNWVNKVLQSSSPVVLETKKQKPFRTLNKTLRLHQWVKNLLIFLPLVVTHQLFNTEALQAVTLAFVAFGFAASSIYIINDLVDLPNDRIHITKRHRALAAGDASILTGWIVWPLLLVSSLVISFGFISNAFGLTVIAYITLTILYSLKLKKLAVFDVITLSLLYTMRIIAGAIAIQAMPSMWILSFSLFFFFSLALMKRFSELLELKNSTTAETIAGRGYRSDDLELVSSFGAGAGLISVLVFLLYIHDPSIAALYSQPLFLWLGGVILLIWITRAWLHAHRGLMHEDPIVFALKDKFSFLLVGCLALVFIVAMVF